MCNYVDYKRELTSVSRQNQRIRRMTTTKRRTEPEKVEAQIIVADTAAGQTRNPGMPLDLDWVRQVHVNRSAVERRAATLSTRRTVKRECEARALLRAFTRLDVP